jgi:hypothetical protein
MSTTSELYLARAADAAQQAEETNLANVKESCLRSEAAWRSMAERAIRAENIRDAARPNEGTAA